MSAPRVQSMKKISEKFARQTQSDASSQNRSAGKSSRAGDSILQRRIDSSAAMQLQRQKIDRLYGGSVQRNAGEGELLQDKFNGVLQRQPKKQDESNKTGMPDQLKQGIEFLSGMDMSGLRVHYASPKPAQLNAHAYARGSDIHLAPGQEEHLPHEAWHAVQQRQGRVQPTTEVAGEKINDNDALEREADVMGEKAQRYNKGWLARGATQSGRR